MPGGLLSKKLPKNSSDGIRQLPVNIRHKAGEADYRSPDDTILYPSIRRPARRGDFVKAEGTPRRMTGRPSAAHLSNIISRGYRSVKITRALHVDYVLGTVTTVGVRLRSNTV